MVELKRDSTRKCMVPKDADSAYSGALDARLNLGIPEEIQLGVDKESLRYKSAYEGQQKEKNLSNKLNIPLERPYWENF